MRFIITILLLSQTMNLNFENLLDKNISFVEDILKRTFKRHSFNSTESEIVFYSSTAYEEAYFFGAMYQHVSLQTNINNTVKSITLHFNELLNLEFYKSSILEYGMPSSILIIDKRHIISENFVEDDKHNFNQHLRKSELELREGTFEENPLYIIWKKDKYMIKALLRHDQNISEITFSLIEF